MTTEKHLIDMNVLELLDLYKKNKREFEEYMLTVFKTQDEVTKRRALKNYEALRQNVINSACMIAEKLDDYRELLRNNIKGGVEIQEELKRLYPQDITGTTDKIVKYKSNYRIIDEWASEEESISSEELHENVLNWFRLVIDDMRKAKLKESNPTENKPE